MALELILIAALLSAVSGIPSALAGAASRRGQQVSAILGIAASVAGIAAAVQVLGSSGAVERTYLWNLPGGIVRLRADALSAGFLLSIHVISALATVYGLEYWPQAAHPANGRKLRLSWGLMTGAMTLLVVASNAILFLVAWEVMALAGFFLVTTESHKEDVREAGWVYFVATHASSLALFAFFALYRVASGSFDLRPLDEMAAGPATANVLFLLALVGFGIKAGIFPFHVWLPSAHANSPSHVSAMLSGVLIKLGVYGVMRACWLLPVPPLWWGVLLTVLGACSGVYGVVFAIGQHDLKRLLAYHSIENIGIIFLGLGLAVFGQACHEPAWVALGIAGAMLHVWNHGLFKSLLFLGAGSVLHATGTREIDHLGGLAKRMPWTSGLFMVGAAAICGLPPLNGFISELLIYVGYFRVVIAPNFTGWSLGALAIPALGLIGGLAVACFVKVHGAVFLGEARKEFEHPPHEAGLRMLGPMGALAALCFAIGLLPVLAAPGLEAIGAAWASRTAGETLLLGTLAPLELLSMVGPSLLLVALVLFALLAYKGRAAWRAPVPTWGCGYAAPSARMQYTASSFGQMLVGLYRWLLIPRAKPPHVTGLFPASSAFHSEQPDVVLDRAVHPTMKAAAHSVMPLRMFQHGRVQFYALYILLTLLALLAVVST
ncbi:MAG: hydrogenase [Candidatus Hydrogenedentes bacterium]|nr:hydrogenase [Candidatus Hydrogenedentota bacterium]